MTNWNDRAQAAYPSFMGVIDKEAYALDIRRFYMVTKMCRRYLMSGEINYKLILNNIIVLTNIFTSDIITDAFDEICDDELRPIVNSFLVFLNVRESVVICQQIDDLLHDLAHRY